MTLSEVSGSHFVDEITCSITQLVDNSVDFICIIDYAGFLEPEVGAGPEWSTLQDVLLNLEDVLS